jgi:hypothetical protein
MDGVILAKRLNLLYKVDRMKNKVSNSVFLLFVSRFKVNFNIDVPACAVEAVLRGFY